ncbi:MMPL family transporter [Plantactinospora veratri]|uniref:MMPL family transporter n=1 Tax=Plantactinospora veratri TaxID=1436122 RepID=A0ABU7SET6_9ACTN
MAASLYRLGAWTYRRRRTVLVAWLALLVAAGALAATAGGSYSDDFSIPGSRAQQTLDTVAEQFPASSGASAQVVFVAPAGHRIAEHTRVVEQTLGAAAKLPQVAGVLDPFTARTVSTDGRTALATVDYQEQRTHLADGARAALEDVFQPAREAGLRVEFGGSAYDSAGGNSHGTEAAGLLIALVVLVITFGSLVAAGLPLLTALLGVGVTVAGLTTVAGMLTLPPTAPALALMLGLAVGIDYALFIVARHRSQLASGMPVADSVARTIGTAGTAVAFAGLTVVVALAGLTVVRIPFLTAMGLAATAAVIVAVLVAVTLIPAVLGFAGDRLRPKPGSRAVRRATGDGRGSMGGRWVRLVTRRPLVTTLAVVAALGVLAVPAAGLRLALTDNGSAPAASTQRQAYDLIAGAFGPGFNAPLPVLADLAGAGGDEQAAATALADRLGAVDGVAAVGRPQLSADGRYAMLTVIPETGPQDERTERVVTGIEDAGGESVAVTGVTAIGIDISELLSASLVPFALVVVGLAFLLLLLAFRSLLVPLKATLGFLLSVGATLGAVVAVFQWGWLAELVGVARTGPVISFMPIILMAVLFGLAMDYEVFLVSRMHEEYAQSGDPRRAVDQGFRASARVVAAAALIMVSVFASFIPVGDATLKPIAFALAVGVLLDAFLVRMTLVPALLALARHGAWWLPRWLDRVLPNLDVEGARLTRPVQGRPAAPAAVV